MGANDISYLATSDDTTHFLETFQCGILSASSNQSCVVYGNFSSDGFKQFALLYSKHGKN